MIRVIGRSIRLKSSSLSVEFSGQLNYEVSISESLLLILEPITREALILYLFLGPY